MRYMKTSLLKRLVYALTICCGLGFSGNVYAQPALADKTWPIAPHKLAAEMERRGSYTLAAKAHLDGLAWSALNYKTHSVQYAHSLYDAGRFLFRVGMKEQGFLALIKASEIYIDIYTKEARSNVKRTPEHLQRLKEMELQLGCLYRDLVDAPYKSYFYEQRNVFIDLAEEFADKKIVPIEWAKTILTAVQFYMENGEYERAERKIVSTQKMVAKCSFAHYQELRFCLGTCYLMQNEIEKAEKVFLELQHTVVEAEETAHLYGAVQNQLTSIYILQGKLEIASECLRITLKEYLKKIPSLQSIISSNKAPCQLSLLCYTASVCEKMGHLKTAYELYYQTVVYFKMMKPDKWELLDTSFLWEMLGPYFEDIRQFAIRHHNYGEVTELLYEVNQIKKVLFAGVSAQKYTRFDLSKDSMLKSLYQVMYNSAVSSEVLMADLNQDLDSKVGNSLYIYYNWRNYVESKLSKSKIDNFEWPKDSKQIRELLSADEAIVEFFTATSSVTHAKEYFALIVSPHRPSPDMVKICEEELLKEHLNEDTEESRATLYDIVWRPLSPYLSHTKEVYVVSDRLLHTLSYASLKDGDQYLIDQYKIHHSLISSNLTLLKAEKNSAASVKNIFLFGGVDFTRLPDKPNLVRSQGFHYLPGSQREVRELNALLKDKWNVTQFTGQRATEEIFRNLSYKQQEGNVIHISTHGFYLPYTGVTQDSVWREEIYSHFNDPLIRSGFALSGANIAWHDSTLHATLLDGVVTAFEVGAMELGKTELVVLSACNTGTGMIKDGEGVFGLQRAFRRAGVNSMLVTLWEIPDRETVEFMTHFYSEWIAGHTKREAFTIAQRKMRHAYPDDYKTWAGFVLIE